MRFNNLRGSLQRRLSRDTADHDMGFGDQLTGANSRLLNQDGSFNVERRGAFIWSPYHIFVEVSWGKFLLFSILAFIVLNTIFALGFMYIGIETLDGAVPSPYPLDNFTTAFYFSVQTFTTVGYGAIAPMTSSANVLASLDALVGLASVALMTGMIFARFSKPKALIAFSEQALIAPYRDTGYRSLQFRIANRRNNKLINLSAQVNISWLEQEGDRRRRRFANLPLERDRVSLFPLNWTIVHILNKDSPLYGWTEQDFKARELEVIILVAGYDETYAQGVHTNGSYTAPEIIWNARFNMMYFTEEGRTVLELDRIHDFMLLGEEEE